MASLYLLRGLPGAGKSTLATQMGAVVTYEADQYFMKSGQYKFDPTKLKEAHAECLEKTRTAMSHGIKKIAVSNTFTQDWEMEKYFELAKEHGYVVFSIIVENRHGGVNIHGVPEEKLQQMKDRFEVSL